MIENLDLRRRLNKGFKLSNSSKITKILIDRVKMSSKSNHFQISRRSNKKQQEIKKLNQSVQSPLQVKAIHA